MKKKASEIYQKLKEERIDASVGRILFSFGGVDVTIKKKDVIGNVIQEWFECWLENRQIEHRINPNSQMPPDIFLGDNDNSDLLEIKSFDMNASPNFDIADFVAFKSELLQEPYHIDTDYLIFGYTMDTETGAVSIREIWLKKLWEISRSSKNWPINVQCKKGRIQKIRPATWYSQRAEYPIFQNKTDYISAFAATVLEYFGEHEDAPRWKQQFIRAYKNFYNVELDVPAWTDIRNRYQPR